jgi:hypothetical protein
MAGIRSMADKEKLIHSILPALPELITSRKTINTWFSVGRV